MTVRNARWGRIALAIAVTVPAAAVIAGCGSSSPAGTAESSSGEVSLVAYAVPEPAYAKLIPGFQATEAGNGATFTQSYGASGDQSRAVANGLPASIVNFSVEPDIDRLVEKGIVATDWNAGPYKGVPADSLVVLGVRPGNPKGITGWEDLTKDGVEVVTADFKSSGSAKWNALAAWGAAKKRGATDAEATNYLNQLYGNVVAQEKSGREATNAFASGLGDVVLTYENEAIAAKRKGVAIDYVVPAQTMLIQAPVAVTDGAPAAAAAFNDYLYTPGAQKVWCETGFRPVEKAARETCEKDLPKTDVVFDIGFLGGWSKANDQFFEEPSGIAVTASAQAGS